MRKEDADTQGYRPVPLPQRSGSCQPEGPGEDGEEADHNPAEEEARSVQRPEPEPGGKPSVRIGKVKGDDARSEFGPPVALLSKMPSKADHRKTEERQTQGKEAQTVKPPRNTDVSGGLAGEEAVEEPPIEGQDQKKENATGPETRKRIASPGQLSIHNDGSRSRRAAVENIPTRKELSSGCQCSQKLRPIASSLPALNRRRTTSHAIVEDRVGYGQVVPIPFRFHSNFSYRGQSR